MLLFLMVAVNEKIAYFLGVLHSDGCIYQFFDKKEKRIRYRLLFKGISERSLPMLKECQVILASELNRSLNIRRSKKGYFNMETCINKLPWLIINNYDIPIEIRKNSTLFGAYLAGIIDGDGHVHIKHNRDRKIPQGVIKIASAEPLREIRALIEEHIHCSVNFEFTKSQNGQGYKTYFYISYKNINFLENFILPYLKIIHKRKKLTDFIRAYGENEPRRIRTPINRYPQDT